MNRNILSCEPTTTLMDSVGCVWHNYEELMAYTGGCGLSICSDVL